MAKIITDDIALRKFIPNVFATVDDETPLYEKLSPFLDVAEQWLTENVVGEKLISEIAAGNRESMFSVVAMIVVADAFSSAVPSLDLVLTPNGFGIVNNNNIAPASKERVERLVKSLCVIKSRCLTELLPMLRADKEWHDSRQCEWLAESVIQDMELVRKCAKSEPKSELYGDFDTDRWGVFLEVRRKAYLIEQEISNGWISPELMARLCKHEATSSYEDGEHYLISLLRGLVCATIRTGSMSRKLLDDAVTYIRTYPDLFPEWHNSATAELFAPPIFENEKKSSGYFF